MRTNPLYLPTKPSQTAASDGQGVAIIFGFLLGAAATAFGIGLGMWAFG